MEKIIAYTGGEARGNPGPASAGVYITDEVGTRLKEVKEPLGNGSNSFAKYYGVMLALQTLVQLYGPKTTTINFEIRLDSEVVKKQLNSESQINDPGLVPMFIEIHNMRVASFPKLTFKLITAEENTEAKRLADEALADR